MDLQWKITVWGVRGSAPRPSRDCMEYGGNTSCLSLERDGQVIVLDCGSGMAALGQTLSRRRELRRIDVLISHLHLDHIQGLVSFQPLFDPGVELHFYGPPGLKTHLTALLSPPYWPLDAEKYPLTFHELRPGDSFSLNGLAVSTMAGYHPGGCLYYRLDGEGKSLVYALDCELTAQNMPSVAAFAQNCDLLVLDAHFAPGDLRPGWGHSTWEQSLALGLAAKAQLLLMSHYNWQYTDEFLREQERAAAACADGRCRFAKEGAEILL